MYCHYLLPSLHFLKLKFAWDALMLYLFPPSLFLPSSPSPSFAPSDHQRRLEVLECDPTVIALLDAASSWVGRAQHSCIQLVRLAPGGAPHCQQMLYYFTLDHIGYHIIL